MYALYRFDHPDGLVPSTVTVRGGSDTLLRVRTVGIGAALDVPVDGSVTRVAFSPDDSKLVVADFETVLLRDSSAGSAVWEGPLDPGNSVNTVKFGRTGSS
ncbi:hypothetical protein [Streptomyces sp. NPDC001536]|uniref:hypothetical protein n=1 Tax=Streptomyces sp. NPDC001536 TaxID=3364583 RepID=UPI0036D1093A